MRWRRAGIGRLALAASMATTVVVAGSADSAFAAPILNPHVQVQGSPACRSNSTSELWKLYDGPPVAPVGAFQIADAANQEMFVATADGRVFHNYNDPTSGPVGWSTLGGPPSGIFGSVRNGTNYLSNQELYVRANNGQVYHLYATPGQGSGWQGWDTLGAPATTGIAGDVYEGTNYLRNQELYVLGNDGNVYHKFSTPGAGTGWSNWDTMSRPNGVKVIGDVQIGINYLCNQEIYVTGSDGTVYHKFSTPGVGTGWSEWDSMGKPSVGVVSGGFVTAGENFANNQELFLVGADRVIYHDFSTPGAGSGWSGWGSLGAPAGMTGKSVVVDTYPQEKLTVTTTPTVANPSGILVNTATPGQGTGWTGWFDPASAPPLGTFVNFRHGPEVSVRTPPDGQPTSYAYVPSVMVDGSQYKMWYCGSPADTLSYSTSATPGGPWSTPVGVFGASGVPGKFDALLTCDPSVIKVNGTYYMYYSGSPGSPPPGGFGTQGVGLATSTDGVNWTRSNNGDAVRTPKNSSQVARPGCATNSYGAGQPSAMYKDGQFYLLYEDTSSQASTCASSTGVYVIRSTDPTFPESKTQVLTANGFVGDSASTKASFQLGNGFVSADWMYSDIMGRYLLVINGNGGTKNTELYQFGTDFKEVVKVTNIPVTYDWSEGPGLARTTDGHAPAQTVGSPRLVPIDLFYSKGAISSVRQSDIVTSGVDISAGPG